MASEIKVTPYQEKVYALLKQIPSGKVSTYKHMSDLLNSSPRAIGGALRRNPFDDVPCHRVIASDGYIGGVGDWSKAPSGMNCSKKLEKLRAEGVLFNEKGILTEKDRIWCDFEV